MFFSKVNLVIFADGFICVESGVMTVGKVVAVCLFLFLIAWSAFYLSGFEVEKSLVSAIMFTAILFYVSKPYRKMKKP